VEWNCDFACMRQYNGVAFEAGSRSARLGLVMSSFYCEPMGCVVQEAKGVVYHGLELISSTITPHVNSDQTDFDLPQVCISSPTAKYKISLRL